MSDEPHPFPAPPPVAAPQRVILAVGLPGSGKSTYFARRGILPLSSDWLRQILADDPAEQRFQDIIFIALRYLLRLRLKLGRPLSYVDATNLTKAERVLYVNLAENYGAQIEAVFFDVPLDVCQQRNRVRRRVVPEEAMQRLAAKLERPRLGEGFSRITTVSAEGREAVEEAHRVGTSQ